jgi:hypothetical protein
MQNFR